MNKEEALINFSFLSWNADYFYRGLIC